MNIQFSKMHLIPVIVAVLVSAPATGEVVLTTTMIPMRDGIKLSTDIYRDPANARAPVVLMRTPYNKDRAKAAAQKFASAGFVAAVQDCRGKFASEGIFIPYNNEGQDGFDCIEWLGKQPWCNGRIGMWGSSYVGATQWQAAAENPPGLVTITPTATWSSFYKNLYLGGAVRLSLIAKWASGNSPKPEKTTPNQDWDKTLSHLPLSEVDDQIGWSIPWLEAMLTHPSPGGYWKRLDLTDELPRIHMPIQHVVGYYDFFARESVHNFMVMSQKAIDAKTRACQQLILGPWDHGTIGKSKVGELDFGAKAEWDATAATLEWFKMHLATAETQAKGSKPSVRYFILGDNDWRDADSWPPAGHKETAFYLHSEGKANTRKGDGQLNQSPPIKNEPPDQFLADPVNPVPAAPVSEKQPLHAASWAPVNQKSIEDRKDVLVYSTEALKTPLTFAGNAKAEIAVSSNTPDADWVVKLVDVHPDESAYNLAVGILRGRYRESEMKPKLLEPGKIYPITVDLGPIAATIKPGHKLRVDICGAYFPLFDRNPNTVEGIFGKSTAVATESVHHSTAHPSRILLPVKQGD